MLVDHAEVADGKLFNEGVQRFSSASLLEVAELSDGRDVCCLKRRGETIASRRLRTVVEPDNRAPVVRH
jgi:hypothetical protein